VLTAVCGSDRHLCCKANSYYDYDYYYMIIFIVKVIEFPDR